MATGGRWEKRHEGTAHTESKVAQLLERENPWRVEPQERYRGEINPEGLGRSKPARGCETLKPEGAEDWDSSGKPDSRS
jgi:hypothetical protein